MHETLSRRLKVLFLGGVYVWVLLSRNFIKTVFDAIPIWRESHSAQITLFNFCHESLRLAPCQGTWDLKS